MNIVIDKITAIHKSGNLAEIHVLADSGKEHVLSVPMETLWIIGTDLRQAAIRLLAPIQPYTANEPGAVLHDAAEKESEQDSQIFDAEDHEVKTGFHAVEQSWEMCDFLNTTSNLETDDPVRIFNEKIRHHWLVDPEQDNVQSLKERSYFHLRNGFVIRYREEQSDWIPDRIEQEDDQSDAAE